MNKIITLSILSVIFFSGCIGLLDGCGNSTIKIGDYYQIRRFESLPNIDGRNIFYCKLGFEGDTFINHVKYIEWNEKLIKIITEGNKHYIIKAKKETLCCGCRDIIVGPLNKKDFDDELRKIGQIKTLSNVKRLKK